MRTVAVHVLAFAAAAVAPTVVLLLVFLFVLSPLAYGNLSYAFQHGAETSLTFGLVAFIASAAHVVALGLPVFLILAWRRLLQRLPLAMGGFVAGGIPIALVWWPLLRRYADGEDMQDLSILGSPAVMNDGVPTLAGLVIYTWVVAGVGLVGAFGGLVFWATRHRLLAPTAS